MTISIIIHLRLTTEEEVYHLLERGNCLTSKFHRMHHREHESRDFLGPVSDDDAFYGNIRERESIQDIFRNRASGGRRLWAWGTKKPAAPAGLAAGELPLGCLM